MISYAAISVKFHLAKENKVIFTVYRSFQLSDSSKNIQTKIFATILGV